MIHYIYQTDTLQYYDGGIRRNSVDENYTSTDMMIRIGFVEIQENWNMYEMRVSMVL